MYITTEGRGAARHLHVQPVFQPEVTEKIRKNFDVANVGNVGNAPANQAAPNECTIQKVRVRSVLL